MSDREREYDNREVVGVWIKEKVVCLDCAGADRMEAAHIADHISRGDVQKDQDLNYCDMCGDPLI